MTVDILAQAACSGRRGDDPVRQAAEGERLKPDPARALEGREEEALSAEQGRVISMPEPALDTFIPAVAQETWKP